MASEADRRAAWCAAALVAIGAVALAVFVSGRPPDGPVAVDWDGTRCARCGMLVSDPAFAAQLHARDGAVRLYDDPGCLLSDLVESGDAHAVWLHHHREPRWIPLEDAAFVRVPHSPMGYGLAVVSRGESADALDVAEAIAALSESPPGEPTIR